MARIRTQGREIGKVERTVAGTFNAEVLVWVDGVAQTIPFGSYDTRRAAVEAVKGFGYQTSETMPNPVWKSFIDGKSYEMRWSDTLHRFVM
jgi:hypothetical protein